jgi:hypothetical protein
MKEARHLRLLGATGKIRAASYQEREHLVVPVTALVQGVVHSANAEEPEFVPAEVFQFAPSGWNGRPVVGGHPVVDGNFVSANSPEVLEKECFGTVFNTSTTAEKLLFEAWIDAEKAQKSGPVGQRILERLRNNEVIEVSVGAFVEVDNTPGEYNGKQYAGSWRKIVPDHFAILDEGVTGACSVEMGCGTMRSAMVNLVTKDGIRILKSVNDEVTMNDDKPVQDKKQKFFDKFLSLFQVSDNGELTILDIEDKPVVEEVHANCGCKNKGEQVMTKEQRVQALIDSKRFLEADKEWLSAVPEDRLTALEGSQPPGANDKPNVPQPEPAPAPAPAPQPSTTVVVNGAPNPKTVEQFLEGAPSEIREAVLDGMRMNAEKKDAVIKLIKDTGRCKFQDAELKAMSINELQRLADLAGVEEPTKGISFFGVNTARPEQTSGVPSPIGLVRTLSKQDKAS